VFGIHFLGTINIMKGKGFTMKRYDQSFKDSVVEQVALGVSRVQVAKQFGCSLKSVNNWVAAASSSQTTTTGSNGSTQANADDIIAKQAARIRRLEKENEILEKATAFFAAKTMR